MLLLVLLMSTTVFASELVFSDFSDLTGLNLVGNANQVGTVLRLVPAYISQRGAAWTSSKQCVGLGFDTTFSFKITYQYNGGADGLAFVIQNHAADALGGGGGGIGYQGIPNSLAVEFDTWFNGGPDEPNGNHVSVRSQGIYPNWATGTPSLATAAIASPQFSWDGLEHTARITYVPGSMVVYLDSVEVLAVAVDLSSLLSLDSGTAYVGFTGATGAAAENEDILSWSYSATCNQPPVADPNGPYYGDEGSPVTFDGTGSSDPDGDPLTYDWDFGDGSPVAYNAGPTPSHTYDDNGVYDICLTVTDSGGLSDTQCSSTTPMDVVFALDSSGSMQTTDPSGIRKTAAKAFVDKMDSAQDLAGVVSWDDNIDFTYPLSSDFTTVKSQIDMVDSIGLTNLNAGLNAAIGLLDSGKQAGSSRVIVFLSNGIGTYTYAGDGGPAADADAKGYVIYTIGLSEYTWVDGLTDIADATGGTFYPAPTAENLQAIFDDIYVAVTGKAYISNVAPTATFNAPSSVNEGDVINLSLTSPYDPSNADTIAGFEYAFDCGDGSGYGAWSSSNTATCPTDDNEIRTVKGKIRDKDGGVTEYTAAVTINNVAPTADFSAPTYVIAGEDIDLSLTNPFDPSSADTAAGFEYAFDCGDGSGYGSMVFDETGDLSLWNVTVPWGGLAEVSSAHSSYIGTLYEPVIGSEFIRMKTDGPGSFTTATRSFFGKAGEKISGWAFFDAQDYLPFNDSSEVTISMGGTLMDTLFSASVSSVGNYGETPWTYWEYTFPSDGIYTLEAKISNVGDSVLDSYMGLDIYIATETCSTSPDEVGDRTVKGKIQDKDGGVTEYTATVTVLPPSAATNSSLCYYDFDEAVDGQQFKLIFTPDMQIWPASKLPASNPGQFFYNVFYVGDGPASFAISIPEPFEFQGANPVHVYTGVSVIEENGFKCFEPDPESEIYAGDFSGLSGLSNFDGFLYVAVHLDYGLKGTTGYLPNFDNDALDATDETKVLIYNFTDYTFEVGGSQTDSQTIQNVNDFKKIPGFGGLVTQTLTTLLSTEDVPIEGQVVEIFLDGTLLGTATTDKDGWFMFEYKHTGKPAEFVVRLGDMEVTGTLKANKFVEANFEVTP
jgi:hypothetical protein